MARYAAQTKVSPARSMNEIERTLTRYGATGFMYGWTERGAVIGFMMKGRQYKVLLRMPEESEFRVNAVGARRPQKDVKNAVERSKLQRFRALALVIKAKLEAVESEISTVESEFLPWMVLPSGETVGSWMIPQLDNIYKSGKMPPLLPGDRLWVREAWYQTTTGDLKPGPVVYCADGWTYKGATKIKWKPSIHMPRWASRINLEIVKVRIERLKEITEGGASSEGVRAMHLIYENGPSYRDTFMNLWDRLNASRGFGWDVNPWVWVIEFKVV